MEFFPFFSILSTKKKTIPPNRTCQSGVMQKRQHRLLTYLIYQIDHHSFSPNHIFITIDHTILLRRLGNWFGVSGKALDCFKSYLTGRSQRIKLGNCLSSRSDLFFGVPHGSVLGPLLFTLYTTPLSSLVSGHAIPHHLYADDSQLYVSFSMLMIASCMFPFHQATLLQR